MIQIATDFNGLPDVRTMSIEDIWFFYEPLIPGLIKVQKPASS